jgi:hypothetical protein
MKKVYASNLMIFFVIGLISLVVCGCSTTATSYEQGSTLLPTSNVFGIFDANERILLRPAFINGVNQYLRRYTPSLITQNEDYVKMTAKYGYQLNIELIISDREYEIIVTIAQDSFNYNRAQNVCVRIATGVHNSFANYLVRGTRLRDRIDSEGRR